MTLPRFRDPCDRWPRTGDSLPSLPPGVLPGPYEQARAILKMYVPSLAEEQSIVVSSALAFETIATGWTVATFAAVLKLHAPDLFEPSEDEQ